MQDTILKLGPDDAGIKNPVLVLTCSRDEWEDRVLQANDVSETPLLPGLSIPPAECFAS